MPNINFELKREDLKLKLNGNINNIALKELRKIINFAKDTKNTTPSDNNENEEDNNEFYDISYRFSEVSRRLRRNKDFRKLVVNLFECYEDYYIETIKLSNVLELKTKNSKLSKEFQLNEIEFKKQIKNLFKNINKNNVDFLIIHIGGLINEKDFGKAIDSINMELFDVSKKIVKSRYKSNKTLIELIFFGNNIKKNHFSTCNDDDF